jgi:ketoreductase RED2
MALSKGKRMSRTVFITGSTSGIGLATAQKFISRGDTVIFNSVRSTEEGERLAREHGTFYIQGDVASVEDVERIATTLEERCGGLDVLVNNAGRTRRIPHVDIEAATVDVFREIFETNVFGTWQLSVRLMPLLRNREGSIVNVTSFAGVRQQGSSIPYAASKAALNHLTTLLAKVVGPDVRVNAVAPGLIRTPWTADWETNHEHVAAIAPLRRSGEPTDVADAIVALATSPYVTGQILVVDGGLTLVS